MRGVSLEVRAGEIVGLGGLVGSGRSELLGLIYGLEKPESGEVLIEGKPLSPGRPDRAIAAGLGLAPEDRKSQGLLLGWSRVKNVSLADLGRFMHGLLDIRAERRATAEQLRALGTIRTTPAAWSASSPEETSRRLCWRAGSCTSAGCCCSMSPPEGVDVPTKAELYKVISELAGRGMGVLVVSSELEELVGLCSRILIMREGELVFETEGDGASERKLLRHAVAPTETAELVEEVT